MTTRIDVAALIDGQKLGRYQLAVFALCVCFLFLDGFDAQMIGFVAPSLVREWKLNRIALGPIFTTGTLGFSLGAMLFGMLADRFGRRASSLWCLACFGVFNILSATAHSVEAMMIYRFLAGLGMGGGMPNGYALISEYFPRRMRATVIMLAAFGYSFGANAGGWAAAFFIPRYGWPSVFYIGGVAPLVLVVLLWPCLPESIRFLVLKRKPAAQIAALIAKVYPALPVAADATFVIDDGAPRGSTVRQLFTNGRAPVTTLLWIAAFMNLMVLSFVVNWFPTLLTRAGMDLQTALILTATFGIGGNAGVGLLGFAIDRWGAHRVLGAGFLCVSIALALVGSAHGSFVALAAIMLVVGFFVPGGNAGTSAFASKLYPVYIRSTGIGWTLGVGRAGQLLSPILGTLMLAMNWSLASFFYAVAVPALIAALAIGFIEKVRPADARAESEPRSVAAAQ
jgi:AAHS family 4-hydroxybenzoate transporter-like MFS transporter